ALWDRRTRAVAANDGHDAFGEQLLSGLRALLRVARVVFSHGLQHAAVDAAGRVDVVDRELAGVANGRARVRIRSGKGTCDSALNHPPPCRVVAAAAAASTYKQHSPGGQADTEESPF